ncbi:protein of unknown function [Alteromonadaceae bacterium Bs31]|nr:protein of unknown function [Alteromonadaceae bacterium Bs31]
MSIPKKAAAALAALGTVAAVYLGLKAPNNDLDWQAQFKVLPEVTINGDKIVIGNLRDFRYQAAGKNASDQIAQRQYLTGEYQFSQLKQLWYGISHFGAMGMAHVFVSFEFEGGQYLVVSIEARLQNSDDGYHPIRGLFRQYQKTIVLATEQDVIGLRSHIRQEKVYLYPLALDSDAQQELLKGYLLVAQGLQQQPAFYNTFTDNCMTGLLKVTRSFNHWWQWLDYRIMLPGYSDRLSFERGLIKQADSLSAAQARYSIDGSKGAVDSSDFSSLIRQPKAL